MKVLPFAAPPLDVSDSEEIAATADLMPLSSPRYGSRPGLAMQTPRRIRLTRREESIVAALMTGRSNKAIARDLDITEQSVKNRLTQLYRKFAVRSRTEFVLALMHKRRTL